MQFSVLLWSINSIVNLGQDNLFGMFTQEQAQKAQQLFTEMDKKNQAKGVHGVLAPNEMPDNHPLSLIWKELFTLFSSVRIPYQFIRNYISMESPKRSFLRGLISGKVNKESGVNVTLLDEDKQGNKSFLDNQIIHKQFPSDWSFLHDLSFVSIYFASKTDNLLSDSERSVIYKLLGEWIRDKDEKIINKRVHDAFIKAMAEFENDMSKERFEFALENIRRNIYVNFDYDFEKTEDQLKIILNDLLSISEADDEVKIEEVDLINVIKNEWRVNWDNFKDYSDGDDNQETENDDEYENDDDKQLMEILHKCGVESIDDLTTLTIDQSKELASYTGPYLNLSALTTLTEKNAEILAKYNGCLMLDRLVSISDKAIEYLATHSGGFISLDGIISLSDKAISAIAKHDGAIYLNGLTYLSENACIALSKHKDALLLNGVTKISEKGAMAISKHEGELSMDGLISLSVKAAKALSVKGISVKDDDR
jgi:hypothetical protein